MSRTASGALRSIDPDGDDADAAAKAQQLLDLDKTLADMEARDEALLKLRESREKEKDDSLMPAREYEVEGSRFGALPALKPLFGTIKSKAPVVVSDDDEVCSIINLFNFICGLIYVFLCMLLLIWCCFVLCGCCLRLAGPGGVR
jgi:hypothetical protein